MIKMLRVTKDPGDPESGLRACLSVSFEIDGIPWGLGGIDPETTKEDLMALLMSREVELLAQAQADTSLKVIDCPELVTYTPDTLPISEHPAKLVAVDVNAVKPATVRRKHLGETYDVDCFVTDGVKDKFQAGQLRIGDYVLVSFLDENPDTEEKHIAIVTDKVYKSW